MPISLHVITMNNQDKMLRLLTATKGIFDVTRVCDGGSTDHTVDICKMFNCKVVQRKWDDNMSAQHNILLGAAKKGEFILIQDDDEIPSFELLGKLRQYADESKHGNEYRLVKVPSIMLINGVADWTVPDLMRAIENGEQADRFTKMNFFWYDGDVYYSGESHYGLEWEHIKDWTVKDMIPEPYFHYKEPVDIVQCNIQQAFINSTMQGMKLKDGIALMKMFEEEGVVDSRRMLNYLDGGHVSQELKDWFVDHRNPLLGTESDFFEYYFLYRHPEQLNEYSDVCLFIETDPAVIRHLKDLGGYRSYTVDIRFGDGKEYWLPITHLKLHPELYQMLGPNQILIKSTRKKKGAFDLDPFSTENREKFHEAIEKEGKFHPPDIGYDDDDFQTIS